MRLITLFVKILEDHCGKDIRITKRIVWNHFPQFTQLLIALAAKKYSVISQKAVFREPTLRSAAFC
jgi:hypothetical protein